MTLGCNMLCISIRYMSLIERDSWALRIVEGLQNLYTTRVMCKTRVIASFLNRSQSGLRHVQCKIGDDPTF